jgi:hypothetical protein
VAISNSLDALFHRGSSSVALDSSGCLHDMAAPMNSEKVRVRKGFRGRRITGNCEAYLPPVYNVALRRSIVFVLQNHNNAVNREAG